MKINKKYLSLLGLLILLLITVGYSYYVRPIVDDELYNYGFSYNIVKGLIPYKDFNMIIPPLFNYLLSIFLLIFGSKLLVYHFVIALIITVIFYFSYKKIGKLAFLIYLLMLIYPYVGYNVFAIMLIIMLFNVKDNKYSDILEALLISMLFLTKQTLGLLVIPSIIYSKNRKRTISVYLISIFGFLLYLIFNDTVYQFFDYCLFGMFDFAGKNATSIGFLTIVELLIIILLSYLSYKTKRKDIFFCLMFQIMALPIVNYIHFIISFIPVMYLFLSEYKDNKPLILISSVFVLSFFIGFNFAVCYGQEDYQYLEKFKLDTFMKGRVTYNITDDYVVKTKEYIDKYSDRTLYVFGRFSYLIKLNNNVSLNKYDIINNGNMGYNGKDKYIKEIDDHCSKNKCMFIMNDYEDSISVTIQTNMDILKYVQKNYMGIYNSNVFSVYVN